MHRVVVPADSQDQDALRLALAYAQKIGEGKNQPTEAVLFVHTKRQFDQSVLSSYFGKLDAALLSKGNAVSLISGMSLRLSTLKTVRQRHSGSVVIAYFADDSLLDASDDLDGLSGIVAVPDQPGGADNWVARWNAIVHGQVSQQYHKLIEDDVVEAALQNIVSNVNSSTGISHPRDKNLASENLRILVTNGHTLDSGAIRSWAIQQGWASADAGELAKLAAKISGLRTRPNLSGIHNPAGRYDSWVADQSSSE